MKFSWTYQNLEPIKVRTFLGMHGVSRSLLIVAKYHGGDILVNNQHAWTIDVMEQGDTVTLLLPAEQASEKIENCTAPIDILYEDADYLILNKPAGVATVPAHHVMVADSLVNRVKYYYQTNQYENQVTHVATRLDKDTSGIVIFPKHRFAHTVLDQQLKKHQIRKYYTALVSGELETGHGLIDAPITRDPDSFVKRQVALNGKSAQTEFWVQNVGQQVSQVNIMLHTGRTHQIRAHFAAFGHPLLGDEMYGTGSALITRQALHCRQVTFYSPFQQKMIDVHCTQPDDMQKIIKAL